MKKQGSESDAKDYSYEVVQAKFVHLDGSNPRHMPLERERDIIAALCDDQFVALATDIAQMGSLNPLEALGVIALDGQPGHFVALEGNRRTCAILLLSDPRRAPTPEFRTTFSRLALTANAPKNLRVVVFRDRDSAQPWIERRHLGGQGGIGVREWDNASKARAAGRSSSSTSARADVLALAVVDHLTSIGQLTQQQRANVKLTTLSRYLNNASRRSILGLRGLDSANQLVYTHDPAEVNAALYQLVMDSLPTGGADTPRVSSRSDATERNAYVQSLVSRGLVPVTRLAAPTSASSTSALARAASKSSAARSSFDTANRSKLMLPSFTVKTTDKALLRLRKEMLSLPIEGHEFAANYLLRAFVERILVLYLRRSNPRRVYKDDAALCRQCADEASAAAAPKRVVTIVNQSASNSAVAHGLHALGAAVHLGVIPVRRQLIAAFDTWEPALRYMLDES